MDDEDKKKGRAKFAPTFLDLSITTASTSVVSRQRQIQYPLNRVYLNIFKSSQQKGSRHMAGFFRPSRRYCWAGAAGGVAGAGAGAGVALLSVGAIGLAGAGSDWVVEAVVSGDVPGVLHCE